MEKMIERTCRNCGNIYKFKRSASFIAFCPHCRRFDYSECEYVSPVTECTVQQLYRIIIVFKRNEYNIFFS